MSSPQSSPAKCFRQGENIPFITVQGGSELQRKDNNFMAKLCLSQEALETVQTKFVEPISIIVYVGDMGVGKSKFASVSVCSLLTEKPEFSLKLFKSGGGGNSVTQGIWMWSEPLVNPYGQGSVMILDCEGMGSFNEHLSANLYLFCMMISTSFVLVLNSPRVTPIQSERLYHALLRYQQMKTHQGHVLPNIWLLLHTPDYVKTSADGDIVIDKSEWLKKVFSPDPNIQDQLSKVEQNSIQDRFNLINRILTHKDAVKVGYLPDVLKDNNPKNDIWTVFRSPACAPYFRAVQNALQGFLSTGGKVLPGSGNKNLFMKTDELTDFMQKLIDIINNDKMPNPDSLIERFLRARFLSQVVTQEKTNFESKLKTFTINNICDSIAQKDKVESDKEKIANNQKLDMERNKLANIALSSMIHRARCEVLGLDQSITSSVYKDSLERQGAIKAFPLVIQTELESTEKALQDYHEPEDLIKRARLNKEEEIIQKRIEQAAAREQKIESLVNRLQLQANYLEATNQRAATDAANYHAQMQAQMNAQWQNYENMVQQRELNITEKKEQLQEYENQMQYRFEEERRDIENRRRTFHRERSVGRTDQRRRSRSQSRRRSQTDYPDLKVRCPRCEYESYCVFTHLVDSEECGVYEYINNNAVCMTCDRRKPIAKLNTTCRQCGLKFRVDDRH